MSELTNTVCFTCGLVIEVPPRLSRLTNGQVCPACRDRVLDGLPSALPALPPQTIAGPTLADELVQTREDWIAEDEEPRRPF